MASAYQAALKATQEGIQANGGRVTCPVCLRSVYRGHFDSHWGICSKIPPEGEIKRLIAQGVTQQELARRVGCSAKWLVDLLEDRGVFIDWPRNPKPEVPDPESWRVALAFAHLWNCQKGRRAILDRRITCPAGDLCQILGNPKMLTFPWAPCEAPDNEQIASLLDAIERAPGLAPLLERAGCDLRPLVVLAWAQVLGRAGQ